VSDLTIGSATAPRIERQTPFSFFHVSNRLMGLPQLVKEFFEVQMPVGVPAMEPYRQPAFLVSVSHKSSVSTVL
jgi:hypothetical protein